MLFKLQMPPGLVLIPNGNIRNDGGLDKQVMWLTKRGNIDGLHNEAILGENFQKREILMDDISNIY